MIEQGWEKGMKKRVALIVSTLSNGGMERVAAQLSQMFTDIGYEVYLFVIFYDKRNAYAHKGKHVIIPYTFLENADNRLYENIILIENANNLKKVKRKYKVDISISFGHEMNVLNILSGGWDRKILTVHSCMSKRKDFKGVIYNKCFFKLYNYAYKVVVVSRWCAIDLQKNFNIKGNKLITIYNPSIKSPLSLESKEKENIVLVVGRLQDIKQQWHIIRAFSKVIQKVPNACLYFAGKGENEKYLRALVDRYEMKNNVHFLGFVKNIEEMYQKAKVVVFSSASEALPCSIIEAMQYGVPVVAADCPGGIREIIAPELINEKEIKNMKLVSGGVLTSRLDGKKYTEKEKLTIAEKQLADGIILLLSNDKVHKEVSGNCYKISRRFGKDKVLKKWIKIME